MRLSITLLFVAAAGLFATGHAATDLDQTKLSQSQGVAPFENAAGNGKRLLRTVATVSKGDEEERASWADLVARFPGKAENLARKTEKETQKIKRYANDFAIFSRRNYIPFDVTRAFKLKGFSNSQAKKMGLRFKKYEETPSLYH